MQRTAPDLRVPRASPRDLDGDGDGNGDGAVRAPAGSSRDAARQALADAQQRNPVMSAGELFAVAQVNALLAIEETLTALVAELGRRG